MKQPTLKEIKDSLLKNRMTVFNQPYSMNLGGCRTIDNAANTFNDWVWAFYFDSSNEIQGVVIPATTDAGVYYREHPMNKQGVAIIQHNVQHFGAYQLQDPTIHRGQLGHNKRKAFRQVAPMLYWRDNDLDKTLDFEGKTYSEIAYTNGHYMGTVGNQVNNWSAGCWGATEANMNKLFAVCDIQINKLKSDKFSFSLIHENNF